MACKSPNAGNNQSQCKSLWSTNSFLLFEIFLNISLKADNREKEICCFHWLIFGCEIIQLTFPSVQFSSVQSLSHVRLFATRWTAAQHTSLSITDFQSLLKLMFIELVKPSNHFILCCSLLLLPSIFHNIRVFSNEWSLSSHQVAKVLELQLQHQSFQ